MNEPPQTSQSSARGSVGVVLAASDGQLGLEACMESLRAHTPPEVPVARVPPDTSSVNDALDRLSAADVVVLTECCRVTAGWLERLQGAARLETNTATASSLADAGGDLAVSGSDEPQEDFASLAEHVSAHNRRLRPRLNRAVGPCVYVRREAIELVGAFDDSLELRPAIEIDFALRCLVSGLAHVAADDVVVGRLAPGRDEPEGQHAVPLERYPYLDGLETAAEPGVLEWALSAAGNPPARLPVTLDARALQGTVTGTQVHIVELIVALAHTGALQLRVLIRENRIDQQTLSRLRSLPDTTLLDERQLDERTPRTTIYHRPQQAFAAEDVELAVRLGERIVLSQLDLIAYRNPAYFPDASSWQDFRRASRHGLSAAERVVVFSDHTRRELLSDALVDDARIRIVPPGLDHHEATAASGSPVLEDGGEITIPPGFLLCLGTDFRHKNRVFALRLLASLRERHGWQGSLVLAGTHIPNGSSSELEQAFLEDHQELDGAVVRLGSVSEEERLWLMAHAGAVLYPSVYEGFGLVPFESGLAGVPCVFAPWSSLAEVAPQGTATILPWNVAESAEATYALLTEQAVRERHVEALAAAARKLTWEATAVAMVEVYREAACAPAREAARLSRDAVERERRLTAAHHLVVERLIGEREHARGMYDALNAEVGSGLSLIGPHGTLPDEVQRTLLALGKRPALSRPVYRAVSRAFIAARAVARALRRLIPRRR